MANSYFYSNTAQQTTASGSISSGALSIGVVATTGFPTSYPYVLALDYGAATEELVTVTSAAGTTLNLGTRGFSGTSAQSHSLGAVVRHVYHAGDATDFRTHEAATSDVHGVTGALVGATQTQTLTNKTLTAPTITNPTMTGGGSLAGTYTGSPTLSGAVTLSGGGTLGGTFTGAHTYSGAVTLSGGGTMSGTFTGTPTFSGNVAHSGEIVLTNLLRGSRGTASDSMYESRVTSDANARWFSRADGKMSWGPGSAGADVTLERSATNWLSLTGNLYVSTQVDIATHTAHWGDTGTVSISFTTQTSSTSNVTFGTAFASAPRVFCNINNGGAPTASWNPRAINVTTTGFTVFVFGPSATWSNVEVQWAAFAAI